MSKAVILQHVEYEGPGRIMPVFRDFGIPVEVRRLWRGDPLPQNLDELRVLVVMGGPMGVADIGNPRYPFLEPEVALLRRLVAEDRPVLGICLGAQLLAHAAGAKVYPNTRPGADGQPAPAPEIGWAPIQLPFPGGTDPIVMGLHDGAMMFHWHFDTFDLPKLPPSPTPPPPGAPPFTGSSLLASTAGCRNQAFRFKDRLYGFQFHFEVEPEDIEECLAHGREVVRRVFGPDGAVRVRQDTIRCMSAFRRLGDRVLKNFVQYLKLY